MNIKEDNHYHTTLFVNIQSFFTPLFTIIILKIPLRMGTFCLSNLALHFLCVASLIGFSIDNLHPLPRLGHLGLLLFKSFDLEVHSLLEIIQCSQEFSFIL